MRQRFTTKTLLLAACVCGAGFCSTATRPTPATVTSMGPPSKIM